MRIILNILAVMCLVAPITASAATVIICEKGSGSGYTRAWTDEPGQTCLSSGQTCKVTVIREGMVDNSSVWFEAAPMGGLIMHARLSGLNGESVTGESQSIAMEGFVFQKDEVRCTIAECTEYPEYNGTTIKLDGVVVGQYGAFSVYLPPVR
jgi:hypothetical protein